MSGSFGAIERWNGYAVVVKIIKETEKTVVATTWSDWRKGEWGRETRMGREKLLARFDTFDQAQAAIDTANLAYEGRSPFVEAAKDALRAAETGRSDAFRAALSPDTGLAGGGEAS